MTRHMVLTLLGTAAFVVALAVFVPLLAYGVSALVDWKNWRNRGGDGQGGVRVPRRSGPSGPPTAGTRSKDPATGKGDDSQQAR